MALPFPCIATSRRRRAIAASLASPSTRARRASASLRRTSGLWQLATAEHYALALSQDEGEEHGTPAAPPPTIVSRR